MKTEKIIRTFYRVVTPFSFSNLDSETFIHAVELREEFGECKHGTLEDKAYWQAQREKCYIVKVTEITERM